jgi:hypothetical protein
MNDIAKSDIFFTVTTVVVILIGVAIAVGIVYLIKILRSIRKITEDAQTITHYVTDDLSELNKGLKTGIKKVIGKVKNTKK